MNASNVSIAAIAAQTQIDEEEEQEAYHAYAPVDFGGQEEDDEDHVAPEPIALDVHFDESNVTAQSYEDLCRSHVEQYLANAQNFVQETSLGLRIADWNKRIMPLLEEQDARPAFDIRQYGEKIMKDRFPSEGHEITCSDLMGKNSVPAFEVCRNFVAVLQLVSIDHSETLLEIPMVWL
jgi:condensin-2 complex subunit H2